MSGTGPDASPPVPRARLFFAILPSLAEREALAHAATGLVRGGRRVAAPNLHMTLVFLGSLDAGAREGVERAAEAVTGEAFELEFSRVGHWSRPRVLWCAAAAAPAALFALQGALAGRLRDAGLVLEARPFAPHVTVVRKLACYRGAELLVTPVRWHVDAFRLVESHTLPQGARYHVLRDYPLQAAGRF